ncbi:MAG: hypothetical protein R2867_28205 [Caldilineaceae bacterium]
MATQAMTTVTKRRTEDSGFYDWGLLTIVMILVGFGMVMVFSSSLPKGWTATKIPSFM